MVNVHLAQRLRQASARDATVNAIVRLDMFAKAVPNEIDEISVSPASAFADRRLAIFRGASVRIAAPGRLTGIASAFVPSGRSPAGGERRLGETMNRRQTLHSLFGLSLIGFGGGRAIAAAPPRGRR